MELQNSIQQVETEKYLQQNQVYQLFEDLLKNLIIDKPEDPLSYLADKVLEPDCNLIFIIGPPGSNVRELCLQISDYLGFTCVSVGGLLRKEISKKSNLGQQIDQSIKNFTQVKDDIVIEIVKKHLKELKKENQNIILEGYPKTMAQALSLQSEGIFPNNFIVINYPQQQLIDGLLEKINNSEGKYSEQSQEQKLEISNNCINEYQINLQKVLKTNKQFFQVDGSVSKEEILEDIAKLLKHRSINMFPKRAPQILILGAPGSGCTSLSQKLSQKYGFVQVSINHIIGYHITNQTKIVNECLKKDQPIPDDILIELIDQRVNKKDCQLQGFILDGFPTNLLQLQSLNTLKIFPDTIYLLDLEDADEISFQRLEKFYNRNQINKMLQNFKTFIKDIEQNFQSQIFKINAKNTLEYVEEQACFHIENKI